MNKLKITYDPNGSGDNYGIRIKGDLKTFIKLWKRLIVEKQMLMPLDSHHGHYFFLEDYGVALKIAMHGWTHTNKGNGEGHPMFILDQSKWEHIITEHGHTNHQQRRITLEMKNGFKKLLEDCGFTIADSWNDQQASSTISVVLGEKIIFDATTHEESEKVFLEKLQDMIETLNAVSN